MLLLKVQFNNSRQPLGYNGFGLCVGWLLKPKTVCQHQVY